MLLKGSQHVNLLGPGAGGANRGAGAYLVQRGGRDPALLLSPGWGDPCSGTQREGGCWGVLGRLDAVGCCCQEGSGPVVVPLGDCGWTVSAWSPAAWLPSCWEGLLSSPPRER